MMIISLKQTIAGHWAICRCQTALFSDLEFAPAICIARVTARDENPRPEHQASRSNGENAFAEPFTLASAEDLPGHRKRLRGAMDFFSR